MARCPNNASLNQTAGQIVIISTVVSDVHDTGLESHYGELAGVGSE